MEFGEVQESSPQAPESLAHDFKVKNMDPHDYNLNKNLRIFNLRKPVGSSDLLRRGSKAERKDTGCQNGSANKLPI